VPSEAPRFEPTTSTPGEEVGPLPEIGLRLVASHLTWPTYITHAGDGSGRLFILERRGKIRVIENGRLRAEPFLDLFDIVNSDNNVEQGLLGLVFHPDFANDRRFFVYYTNRDDDTVLASYRVSPDLRQVEPGSAKILLTISQPFTNHNGGQLAFGPDGYLYIGVGEGGLSKDPGPASLLGKILRLDVDRAEPYSVPKDNPFAGRFFHRPEIWAMGLRNPWRFSFDWQTGDLYIADVGENLYEEIDLEPAGSGGGHNYGWPTMEGNHCYEAESCNRRGLTLPIAEYKHREDSCSVSGGYVYRGTQYPKLDGLYFYSDYCSGKIWALRPGYLPGQVLDTILIVSSFGEDEAGELYVVDYYQGHIYQLVVPSHETQTNWPGAWPLADEPAVSINTDFAENIRLIGYSTNQPLARPGGVAELTLFWQGQQIPETTNVFVQVADQENNIVAQADHALYISRDVLTVDGTMLRDGATLSLPPDLPAGHYQILVGLYNPESSERLALIDDQSGQNAAILAEFVVE
jgi:glucose/arabinose dehydrogenase